MTKMENMAEVQVETTSDVDLDAAELQHLQLQAALSERVEASARLAAESAKQTMETYEKIAALKRRQQERRKRTAIDLSGSPQLPVKSEILRTSTPDASRRDETLDEILFNQTPDDTQARALQDPTGTFTAGPIAPHLAPTAMRLIESDVSDQSVPQAKKKRKRRDGADHCAPSKVVNTDRKRFAQVVDNEEFRTITRSLDGDDLVELRCNLCYGNCGSFSGVLRFFKGVDGFRGHIHMSHSSSLGPSGTLTVRQIVERCTYRTLSEDEKTAVLTHDHTAFKVEKILVCGRDRDRMSRKAHRGPTTEKLVKRSRSATVQVSQKSPAVYSAPPAQRTLEMTTRRGGRSVINAYNSGVDVDGDEVYDDSWKQQGLEQ